MESQLIYKVMITSSGNVEGTLYDLKTFQEGNLLYLPNLQTDYFKFVMKARGVIAKQGGICAHMSMVCRELSIPAAVCINAEELIGKYVKLNSNVGELYVYNKS